MKEDRGPLRSVCRVLKKIGIHGNDLERKIRSGVCVLFLDRGVQPVVTGAKDRKILEQKDLVGESVPFEMEECVAHGSLFVEGKLVRREDERGVESEQCANQDKQAD